MNINSTWQNKTGQRTVPAQPEWMKGEDGFAEYLALVEPEIAIEFARYQEAFPYHPKPGLDPTKDDEAYLYLLVTAMFFKDSQSLQEWSNYADAYPSVALTLDQLGRLSVVRTFGTDRGVN